MQIAARSCKLQLILRRVLRIKNILGRESREMSLSIGKLDPSERESLQISQQVALLALSVLTLAPLIGLATHLSGREFPLPVPALLAIILA